jgi:hypothetical protein
MAQASTKKQGKHRGLEATREKKGQSLSEKSRAPMSPSKGFEPQVLEDTDETCWAFVGGVRPPKK